MTLEDASALRMILMKRVVPRDAEEGFALLQLAEKVYNFVAQHQMCAAVTPAAQVADTNGK